MVKIAKNITQEVDLKKTGAYSVDTTKNNKNPINVSVKVNEKASREAVQQQVINNKVNKVNVTVNGKLEQPKGVTVSSNASNNNLNSLKEDERIEASNTLKKNTDDVNISVQSDIELDNTESLTTVVDPKQLGRYEFLEKQSDGTISVKDLGEEVFTYDAAKARAIRVSMIVGKAEEYVKAWGGIPAIDMTISLKR